jgi:CopA family copper-resistance protein
MLTRRALLRHSASAGALGLAGSLLPRWARAAAGLQRPAGAQPTSDALDLTVAETAVRLDGRAGRAVTVNGTMPAPLLRFTEGQTVTIRVRNALHHHPTSIHWHGILLPYQMDGVPGVSFPGIPPGETFTYRFTLRQSGTYWYHSHSGMQEQQGHLGPLIVDPEGPDPVAYDREHVIVLSDWMFEDPHAVMAALKKQSDYSNYQRRTLADFFRDASRDGLGPAMSDRLLWGRMRMKPSDIADVTGHLYTYTMNGRGPEDNWTGLFTPGERVRLRVINASAMSYFNLRIPGLPMTVVQADGQNVEPVTVDELQIAVAETFDVVVEPPDERAFTLFAESMDRTGFARGTLAPREGMRAEVPALREPPRRTMVDMGMDHDHAAAGSDTTAPAGTDHAGHDGHAAAAPPPAAGDHAGHVAPAPAAGDHADHADHAAAATGRDAPMAMGAIVARHGPDHHGPGNAGVAEVQRNRLGEPGTGLAGVRHRVLVYTDLRALTPYSRPDADRELELHLTGNMERYMWSFDGRKYSEVKAPIAVRHGERVRLILVNDTMMEHPIHLHGMWMELENGHGERIPRKHTVSVKPGERLSVLVDADAPGRWAFHCHLLFHMDMGMFRVVEVSPYDGEIA